jgi:hypothetical protein
MVGVGMPSPVLHDAATGSQTLGIREPLSRMARERNRTKTMPMSRVFATLAAPSASNASAGVQSSDGPRQTSRRHGRSGELGSRSQSLPEFWRRVRHSRAGSPRPSASILKSCGLHFANRPRKPRILLVGWQSSRQHPKNPSVVIPIPASETAKPSGQAG